jgi:hypothetical protein
MVTFAELPLVDVTEYCTLSSGPHSPNLDPRQSIRIPISLKPKPSNIKNSTRICKRLVPGRAFWQLTKLGHLPRTETRVDQDRASINAPRPRICLAPRSKLCEMRPDQARPGMQARRRPSAEQSQGKKETQNNGVSGLAAG